MTNRTGRGIMGAVGGALLGFGMWVAMIVITTGVCSVPILRELWCTVIPYLGPSVYSSITLWDMFLLVVFVVIGASTGCKSTTTTRR